MLSLSIHQFSAELLVRISDVKWKYQALFTIALWIGSNGWVSASERNSGDGLLGFPDARSPFYGELHFGAASIRLTDLDFFPLFASVTAGVFVLPNIGIEVFADAALSDEDNAGFDMELTSSLGIAARFQSPPRSGLSGYVVLGLVDYTLTQTARGATLANAVIEEDFRGARVSVGIVQQLKRVPQLAVSIEYRSYYADEPINVDGIVLGLRISP